MRFAPGVIEELARLEFTNVRELQGALNRLVAQQSLDGTLTPAAGARRDRRRRRASSRSAPRRVDRRRGSGRRRVLQLHLRHRHRPSRRTSSRGSVRVGETVAYWASEGYRTAVLERADVRSRRRPRTYEAVLRGYGHACRAAPPARDARSRRWTRRSRGTTMFRDPERLPEAAAFVERALTGAVPPQGPQAAFERRAFQDERVEPDGGARRRRGGREPGQRYNPLFIAGPSGIGQDAPAQRDRERARAVAATAPARVACVGAQLFIDELIAALQEGQIERFRARYRAADVAAHRRRAVRGRQGADAGRALPRLQPLPLGGEAARPRERRAAQGDRRARGAAAVAVRGRPRGRCSRRPTARCARSSRALSRGSRARWTRRSCSISPNGR